MRQVLDVAQFFQMSILEQGCSSAINAFFAVCNVAAVTLLASGIDSQTNEVSWAFNSSESNCCLMCYSVFGNPSGLANII